MEEYGELLEGKIKMDKVNNIILINFIEFPLLKFFNF